MKLTEVKSNMKKAYGLLHDGCVALSEVEANGMAIDLKYVAHAMEQCDKDIKHLHKQIEKNEVYKRWSTIYSHSMNLDSSQQLGDVLFNDMGYNAVEKTSTGLPKTDIATLEKLDIPFVQMYLQQKKLKKAKATYLRNIRMQTIDGLLHPVFNLHLVSTYRSSCDSPNIQNMPIREPMMGKLIRQAFVSRWGDKGQIAELDYGGIEVHGACWYHEDPQMFKYLANKKLDMHRDMAQECFMLPKSEMVATDKADAKRISNIRYCGKNCFVFPQFYGDWWLSCGFALWAAMEQRGLHLRDGTPLRQHLKNKGISKVGSMDDSKNVYPGMFLHHIKNVEQNFWNKRFPMYNLWRKKWVDLYYLRGYFNTLSGFRIGGLFKKNEVINYPVQGAAFHCLLWSLIQIQKKLHKYKMKSLIIGQIHDSIIGDIYKGELKQYLEICNQVMCHDIRKHWKWIETQIEIEADVSPLGKSWYDKESYELPS